MTRFILAFLAVASTVAGQDVTVGPNEYGTVESIPGGSFTGHDLGLTGVVYGYPTRRQWFRFDLSEVTNTVSRATLRHPLLLIGQVGRRELADYALIVYRDSGVYEPYHGLDVDASLLNRIWNDLGTGSVYGLTDVSRSMVPGWQERSHNQGLILYPPTSIQVALSALSVANINAQRGSEWAIGLMIPTPPLEPISTEFEYLFADVTEIDPLEGWSLDLTYGTPPPLGDFSGDIQVNQADLDFVLLNWGLTDQEELDAVLLTWGSGLGVASVPEPGSVLLVAFAAIMAAFRRRP